MNKDLEKEYLEDLDHYDESMGIHSTSYQKCKERLIRLAKIDSANPSEALYELNRIDCNITYLLSDCDINEEVRMSFDSIRDNKSCEVIKQYILKAQKEHKALKIIKEKVMPLVSISDGCVWDGERYHGIEISEEDSILLKEVLR